MSASAPSPLFCREHGATAATIPSAEPGTASILEPRNVLKPHRSIRTKLARLVVVSVGFALLIATLLNLWHEARRYVEAKRDTLVATAQVFGAASSQAVSAGDRAALLQTLRGIARVPGVVRAEVSDAGGAPLAEIGSALRLEGDLDLDGIDHGLPVSLLTSRTVRVSVPVVQSGQTVGVLSLTSDTSDLLDRFRAALLLSLVGFAAATAIGLTLSHRLQRSIIRPIVALADAMSTVEKTNALRPMPGHASDDETGILASRFNSMIGEIRRATDEIVAREEETLLRLSRAAEERDDQTGQHIMRVAHLTRLVARALGLNEARTNALHAASPMHDIGKISIPDAILFKPGKLEPAERTRMEQHTEAGYRILSGSSSKLLQLAAEIALTHHERWDGKGYPNQLAGEQIPLPGRITAVADICDALLTARPYKAAWSTQKVRAFLSENSGTHLDPSCVVAILSRWEEVEHLYSDGSEGAPILPADAA